MNAHPQREEDFDLYALGALEGEERRAIEEHVAACAACAAKLAAARGRLALLALSAPPAPPSPTLKARLVAQVRAEAEAAQIAERPRVPSPPAEKTTGFSRWWAAILVPAAGVLAIATVVLWQQNAALDGQLAALRQSAAQMQAQLDDAKKVASLMTASGTVTVSLAAQPGMPQGSAHVMYNMKMGQWMYEGQLDAAPSGKSYQLWVVPMQGSPISVMVFNSVPGRPDHWMMPMPAGVVPKAFAVTIEPVGGMPQPTGPKVLVGAAS